MTVRKKQILPFFLLSLILSVGIIFNTFIESAQADRGLLEMQEGLHDVAAPYGDNFAKRSPMFFVARIIKEVLGILAIVFLALVIFAGIKWMTAGGNEDKVKSATKLLTNAIIGLIIVLTSWAITAFVLFKLTQTMYAPFPPMF